MYGAVDVYYPPSGGARAALVLAAEPTFATIAEERVAWLDDVAPYEPGAFFRRELPATRAVLDGVPDLGMIGFGTCPSPEADEDGGDRPWEDSGHGKSAQCR